MSAIRLAATTQSLELVTSTASAIDWVVSASKVDKSGATPVVTSETWAGQVASATTTTIVSAPAANVFLGIDSIRLSNVGASTNTVTLQLDVSGSNRRFAQATLQAGEFLVIDSTGRMTTYDTNGRERVSFVRVLASVLMPPHFATSALTSTKTIGSGSSYAVYVGKAPQAIASMTVRYRVTTAAATITWAEVAIAKGAINVGGNPTLTVVGFADVSGVVSSTGRKSTTVNVSAGQSIDEGDDLWLIFGNSATTAAVLRAQSMADDIQVGLQGSAASRPSTIVGTPTAFTIEAATTLAPWCAGVI